MRGRRKDRIGGHVGPVPRFIAGMLMLPPYLLTDNLPARLGLTAFFAVLALMAGKRLNFGYFLILVLSVTFFHILSPWGRVLLEIGPLTITAGALEGGLVRSFTLIGMVFLSVAAVRPELELPGRLGGLLGRTFYYFDLIIEGKSRLSRKNFLVSLDNLLMERFDPNREDLTLGSAPVPAKTSGGWPVAISAMMIPWGVWVWLLTGGS